MRLVYAIQFEFGGQPITVPGAPTELPTNWTTTQISVKEAQSIVVH
jgi:hypothetical protein